MKITRGTSEYLKACMFLNCTFKSEILVSEGYEERQNLFLNQQIQLTEMRNKLLGFESSSSSL